ncbi:tryptophan halogenase family protein [Sphingomonas jaspsi]|uniref:tryptophan halogenase family protein n=1 Tax=Sphingomonas jaspsi TaxID=392409 RepID=UPI0004BBB8AD|nr:tryptophan halogenase family protein [Sphingomonas jaspsi]
MTHPGQVVILGGGTAGWMAAMLFNQRWGTRGTRVTLVESKDIGIIGVGEGSTPQLKHFFDTMGIAEADWMPRCNATYKTGIEFVGWSDLPGYERYFHPFPTALDGHSVPQFFHHALLRRNGRDVPAHPDLWFVPTVLADQRRAPLTPVNFPFETTYGYHFDSYLVGDYLREVATARGVERFEATIADVELVDGDIAALVADDGRRITGDLFVDASGFRAALIEGALGEPHISFADNLFNDSAVVMPTPVSPEGPEVATRATALSAGWAWHIPLTSRTGNGYVYSSRYITPEEAEAELRAHVDAGPDVEARHLKMRVGRVERSWVRNCLAIGLAQGFIEPLEATALHIVMATVEGFLDAVDGGGVTAKIRDDFNARIAWRYDGIRDYIACHYRAAQRRDTDYWRDATGHDHLSDDLKAIFTAWFTGQDVAAEVKRRKIDGCYSAVSWHCLLAGYGSFPDPAKLRPVEPNIRTADMDEMARFVHGCALNYPMHTDALAKLSA